MVRGLQRNLRRLDLWLSRRGELVPGFMIAFGAVVASAAGSLLLQYWVQGGDSPVWWRQGILLGCIVIAVGLIWVGRQAGDRQSAELGYFLDCIADRPGYARSRFESAHAAYAQWATRRGTAAPRLLPPLYVDVARPGGIGIYVEAVSRDLRVAFALASDTRRRIHLLVQGSHEANFWLGWHLTTTVQRANPLQVVGDRLDAMELVADRSADETHDSHGVVQSVDPSFVTAPLTRRVTLDGTPRIVTDSWAQRLICCGQAAFEACRCADRSHGNLLIVAIESQHRLDLQAGRPPRMDAPIREFAQRSGKDAVVLWIAARNIPTTGDGFREFSSAVASWIDDVLATRMDIKDRYLAFTGPVPMAALLGMMLVNQGTWSFLAFHAGSYHPVPQPQLDAAPHPVPAVRTTLAPASTPDLAAAEPEPVILRNYTPHARLVWVHDGGTVELPKLGEARCEENVQPAGAWRLDGALLPRVTVEYAAVHGLPDPRPGIVLVVSQIVVHALPERADLAYPAGLLRDPDGAIIGFRQLGTAPETQV